MKSQSQIKFLIKKKILIMNWDFIFELKPQLLIEILFLWKDNVTLTWCERSHIGYKFLKEHIYFFGQIGYFDPKYVYRCKEVEYIV